ncbi:hypothetical protein NLG97_g1520 [Lecanicillium saksenae]|uniref:Uncharacterized protein n=1 Tax=Lecanicillium saksenae TaxID=468837 RepID=A0ACC1R3J5_9HYPO|nr:hypothetical protein NLG97_g1520 [Lecanicillium saksenae]
MPGLLNLPNEMVIRVCDHLAERDVCRLMRARRCLYNKLQKYLYRRNIMHSCSTSLPYVIEAGTTESIDLVLSIECDRPLGLRSTNRNGNTALLAAISTNNVDVALNLISRVDRGSWDLSCMNFLSTWRPLTLAVSKNQEEIVQALVDKEVETLDWGSDSHTRGSPLLLAAKYSRYRLVAMLLRLRNLDRLVTDDERRTALDLAVLSGCWRTVQALLDDPLTAVAQYGYNPLFHAIESRNVAIVETLVRGRVCIIPPHIAKALKTGSEAIVSALLSSRHDLNYAEWNGCGALACAAEGGLVNFVEMLLPGANSVERREALMLAAEYGQWEVANFILEYDEAREAVHMYIRFPNTMFYLQRIFDRYGRCGLCEGYHYRRFARHFGG